MTSLAKTANGFFTKDQASTLTNFKIEVENELGKLFADPNISEEEKELKKEVFSFIVTGSYCLERSERLIVSKIAKNLGINLRDELYEDDKKLFAYKESFIKALIALKSPDAKHTEKKILKYLEEVMDIDAVEEEDLRRLGPIFFYDYS